MKRPVASAVGLIAVLAAVSAAAQVNPRNLDTAANPRGSSYSPPPPLGSLSGAQGAVHAELPRLWKSLSGKYEESEGERRLSLSLKAISPYALSVQTRTAEGVVERGWLVLRDASSSYRSPKVRLAMEYRPDSFRSEYSCLLFGVPTAEGITFESEGPDCSFALGRRVSKVKIEVSSSKITVSSGSDGETSFLRSSGKS